MLQRTMLFVLALAVLAPFMLTSSEAQKHRKDRSVTELKSFRETLLNNELHLNERIKKIDDWEAATAAEVRGLVAIYNEFQQVAIKRSDFTRLTSAIVRRIALLDKEEVCLPLIADVMDENLEWPLRQAYFSAVMNIENPETSNLLLVLADDQSASMRVLAVAELGTRLEDEGYKKVTERINDASWRVRATCLDALSEFASKRNGYMQPVLKGIIEDFNFQRRNHGALLERSTKVLADLTGENFGSDVVAWFQWFARSNGGDEKEAGKVKEGGTPTTNTVWGAKTASKAMVFIIDNSDSMKEPIDPAIVIDRVPVTGDKKEKDPDIDWNEVKTKLDLARAELILTIRALSGGPTDKKSKKNTKGGPIPEADYFTIISYSTHVSVWMEEIVPATEENKKSAIEFLKKLKTDRLTNIYGALNKAFDIAEKAYADKEASGKNRRNNRRGRSGRSKTRDDEANEEVLVPDTIFFLTDGFATAGEFKGPEIDGAASVEQNKLYYLAMDDMLEAIKVRNRVARMTIHSFGIGREHDHKTLKKLAADHRGSYIQLDAKKSRERETDPEEEKRKKEKEKEKRKDE